MQNIKTLLSNQILTTFQGLYPYYSINYYPKCLEVSYFGKFNTDYKVNSVIAVQKILNNYGISVSVNDLANQLINGLDNQNLNCTTERNTISINLTNSFIQDQIKNMFRNQHNLFVDQVNQSSTQIKVLVDFSSPNIAKDMHVGHLRSTIIGDSIATLHELLGYEVHRINHVGDFGLQFGMIIQHLLEKYPNPEDYQNSGLSISDLQAFYKESKNRFDTDPEFAKSAYNKVVLLQSGDPTIVQAWNFIKAISYTSYNEIYQKLNIRLTEVGESFYQNMIPDVITELTDKGLVEDSDGRKIIKVPGYKLPLTLVKSDGGFTYDTTDLAAIRYRLVDLNMDKVFYVIDNGQALHCELFFKVAQLAGWIKPHQVVKHIGFGVILGDDNKKFKSRSGDTVKLNDLLSEALSKAEEVLDQHRGNNVNNQNNQNGNLNPEQRSQIIDSVAYGSLKYADLNSIRTNNYRFSYDRMISFKGNTGTYQLYEYVRICTILENAKEYLKNVPDHINSFTICEKEEIDVCKMILVFPEVIDKLKDDLMFHSLCSYLYDLTNIFSVFHAKCRCIFYNTYTHPDEPKKIININYNRLIICLMTQKVIEYCFKILGISKLQKM